MQLQNLLNYFIISHLSRPCDCCYIYAYTCNSNISAHRACEPFRGKAEAFKKDIILSSQSCSQTEWAFMVETVQLLLLPLWGCCWCKRSGSAGHPMNFSAASFALLHSDAAGNQEWLVPMAVSSNGSWRALYSGGNRRSRLGGRAAWAAPPHFLGMWVRATGHASCPPFTAQNGCSGRFCYKTCFCISVQIPKGQETRLFFTTAELNPCNHLLWATLPDLSCGK